MATSNYSEIVTPVYITGGISVAVGVPDETAFTYGVSITDPIGGVYQDASPAVSSQGKVGGIRITQFRGMHVNLRDSSGNELLGQKLSAASIPVVLASDQSIISTGDAADGPVAPNTAASKSMLIGGVYNTVLPSPTTGQQMALQLDSSGRIIISPLTIASVIKVDLQDGSGNVINSTSNALDVAVTQPLPAGTNTIGSFSVTGTAIGNAPIQNVYSSTNITTGAYVQLVASTSSAINTLYIFDSSGQAMILGIGAPASEVTTLYVPPGGGDYTLHIPAGSRLAYKALTANATSGYLLMSFLG
jgi:hypothetical protein